MDGGIISYEEATGAPPLPSAPPGPPDDTPTEGRELTVTPRGRGIVPAAPQSPLDAPVGQSGSQDTARPGPAGATAAPPPGLISYEEATAPETPHAGGLLSNAPDDGYLSGAAKGAGTAAVKAVGNSLGFVGGLGNFADYLIARGEHAVTGKPVETILADMAKAKKAQADHAAGLGIPKWTDPRNVMPTPESISAPVLKRTGEYVPTSEPGKLAQAGAEAALSVLGPGGGAKVGTFGEVLKGAASMAPGNFAGGAIGQGVTDVTGDPLLGAAAGLGAGAAAQGGAAAVKKVGGPAVMGIPGIDRVPIVGPRVAEARDAAAARTLLHQSSDPEALKDWAAQPAVAPEVPGSPRTTAGTVGTDRGLFQAEKDARNKDNLPFNAIDDAQAAAQKQAITAPYQEGDVFRPGQVIRDRLNAIDAAAEEAQARLRAAHEEAVSGRKASDQQSLDRLTLAFQDAHDRAAQASVDAASPLRDLPPAEQTGAILRAAQDEATNAARQAYKHLYDAVDPDGTLTTVVTPLKEAARSIKTAIDPLAGVQPSGAEAEIHSAIHRLPDVIPFRSLQKLDSRVTAAMADARKNPNPSDPEAISRLTQLKSATMDAIHQGAENQAAHEAKLVEARLMPAELSLESRMRDFAGLEHAEPIGGRATGTDSAVGFFPGARPMASRGAGQAPRPSIPAAGKAPQSLVAFLRQAGGIKEFGGELKARDLHRQFPGLVNHGGMPLDRAREAAAEAGYLGADTAHAVANTDVNDLLDAIDSHPVYSIHDQGRILDREQNSTLRDVQRSYKAAAEEIKDGLRSRGVDPKSAPRELLHNASVLMAHERLPWDDALSRASADRFADEQDLARENQSRASQEQSYNHPEDGYARTGPGETGASFPDSQGRGHAGEARPNFDQAAVERLKAAKAAYSAYQQTFKNPIVKGVLETNGFAGQFRTSDSAIPSKWVVAGDKGYEVAQAFLAASANDPRAVAAMQNASLTLLRKNMPPVGNLHPNALARWKETLAGALRAIDEVSPGFSSRFDSPANATQALLDLGAQQKQQLADFQRQAATRALEHDTASKATMQSGIARSKAIVAEARNSPAGKFLGQGGDRISPVEVENAVGNMLKTGTQGASRMHSLVGSIANDPDAIAGLRKGGTDWMARTFSRSDDALSGAAFIKFIRDNRDVLKELYPTGHVSMLGAVARDMEVNARWRTQTAIKGGSDTAKNQKPMFSEGFKEVAKHTSMMTAAIEGLQAGYEMGGLRGVAVAAAAPTLYLLHSLRSAGIKSVDDLYREALADPEKARLLISKMPETVEGGKLRALTGLLRKGLIVGPAQTRQIETQRDPTRPPVLSPAEAKALPSGAIVRTLDGRTRVRH